jgi:sortase A
VEPRRRSADEMTAMRRALRAVSTVLIISGALLMVDAVLTVVWQEPVSALYARVTQGQLGGDLDELEQAALPPLERRVLERLPEGDQRTRFLARSLKRRLDEGDAAGRLLIPKIGANFVVVDGTSAASLRKGPGLFPSNPWPGGGGTTAIAGHRTTYAAPFRDIDDLERGDRIEVRMPYGSFFYAVERTRIVDPEDVWVLDRVSYDRLVLSACHPLYSAAQRIIVFARLVRSEPRGAGSRV